MTLPAAMALARRVPLRASRLLNPAEFGPVALLRGEVHTGFAAAAAETAEVSAAEVPAAEVSAAEVSAAEVPAAEVSAAEVSAAEVSAAEVSAAQVSAAEAGLPTRLLPCVRAESAGNLGSSCALRPVEAARAPQWAQTERAARAANNSGSAVALAPAKQKISNELGSTSAAGRASGPVVSLVTRDQLGTQI
jgi:hypothetical protein